jgi:hypothetical protein
MGAIATGQTALHEQDFTIPPNGSVRMDVTGNYFRFTEGFGRVLITLNTGGSAKCKLGQGLKNKPFTFLSLRDVTGTGSTGKLLVGWDAEFIDGTISGSVDINGIVPIGGALPVALAAGASVGITSLPANASVNVNNTTLAPVNAALVGTSVVSITGTIAQQGALPVLPQDYIRTLLAQTYMGSVTAISAGGAFKIATQLYNPNTSTKVVYLQSISGWLSAPDFLNIFGGQNAGLLVSLAGSVTSKKSNGGNSVAQLRFDQAAQTPSLGANLMTLPPNAANAFYKFDFKEPLAIMPNFGVTVISQNVNNGAMQTNFEFFEI